MKAVSLPLLALAVTFGGCVNRRSASVTVPDLMPQTSAPLTEERQATLRQALHKAFDWNSVKESQQQSLYEILDLLHRGNLGDERVVAITFISADEALIVLHHRDRSIVVHPSGTVRVQRLDGFWVVVPPERYRPI